MSKISKSDSRVSEKSKSDSKVSEMSKNQEAQKIFTKRFPIFQFFNFPSKNPSNYPNNKLHPSKNHWKMFKGLLRCENSWVYLLIISWKFNDLFCKLKRRYCQGLFDELFLMRLNFNEFFFLGDLLTVFFCFLEEVDWQRGRRKVGSFNLTVSFFHQKFNINQTKIIKHVSVN